MAFSHTTVKCSDSELSTVTWLDAYTNTSNNGIRSRHSWKFQIRTFNHGAATSPWNF